jgi:ABC-type uncharacterized transport system ATPase subunit
MRDSSGSISVCGLHKTYAVHEREAGVMAALRSLAHRRARMVTAVDGITFVVRPGQVVGFLRPNGAGKTTRPLVLHELCVQVAPGRILGVAGRTGSGKTTLTRLLRRSSRWSVRGGPC